MSVTAELVDRLLTLPPLPPADVLARTRLLVLDCLGTIVAGAGTAEGTRIRRYVRAHGGAGSATVVFLPEGRDPGSAALANGTAAYSVGLTDTHNRSISHPGASVIPAALAVGEATGAPGGRVVGAVVRGYEAVTRIGAAISPSHRQRGFHVTGTVNVFGAALAAAYVLGLDEVATCHALGIAGSQAAGVYAFRTDGSMTMAFHAGRAAQSGVLAALLAKDGFTGPRCILEGPDGFCQAYADGGDLETITRGIGKEYELMAVGLRPYCACRYAHAAIDALLALQETLGKLEPAAVESILVETHRVAVAQEATPDTLVGARLSIAFNVALALVDGPRLVEVQEGDLHRADVRAVLPRIQVREAPDLTALYPRWWAARVHLLLRDGRRWVREVRVPKGEPENPLSTEEVEAKFRRLCRGRLPEALIDNVVEKVLQLERLESTADLLQALREGVE